MKIQSFIIKAINGPSRENRNWLDGNPDFYYGGTAGGLKGHKFSLFDGGVCVPAIISWTKGIKAHQVIYEPVAAMDIFPTMINAAGGDASEYDLDGLDIMSVIYEGTNTPHEKIYWEMNNQTAVRCGNYKLVLNGQLVEDEPAQDEIFLYNIVELNIISEYNNF